MQAILFPLAVCECKREFVNAHMWGPVRAWQGSRDSVLLTDALYITEWKYKHTSVGINLLSTFWENKPQEAYETILLSVCVSPPPYTFL
jgi:hypothetical protein